MKHIERFRMMMKYNRQTLPWLARVVFAASEVWKRRNDRDRPQPPKWREGY